MIDNARDVQNDNSAHKPPMFEEVYYTYYRPLYFYSNSIIDDSVESKDIVADAFIKYHERQEQFTEVAQIKSFLYTSVRNAALNILRHRKVLNQHDAALVESIQRNSKGDHFYDKLVLTELMGLVYEEVEKLPEKQKEIFKMSFFEHLTAEEIVDKLGVQIEVVYNNKKRALDKLKFIFKNKNLFLYLFILEFFLD